MPTTRYRIEEEASGRGGFGRVHKGRDTILEREIAVKTLDPLLRAAADEDRQRFQREARILASLRHPNIPSIYDVEFTDSEFRIIFEYVEGTTLRAIVNEEPASLRDVQSWFVQTALALHHAHQQGVIHRDVKPDNMIITPDKRHCYLVDFGLALSVSDRRRITGQGEVFGTPGYMSPEQENGEEVDASSDVYSLGVSLYEALCGHRIPAGDYEELSIANETIPPAVDALVLACIAPKSQRLSSAAEFAIRLSKAAIVTAPLSQVLVEGHLHEIIGALRQMTPQEFMQIQKGQRLLVLNKALDVLGNDDPKLKPAQLEFARILPGLAIHIESETYEKVIAQALPWAFERPVGAWTGDQSTREALEGASVAADSNHPVLCKALLEYLGPSNLRDKPGWFYHEARDILVRLMANPACSDEHAEKLNSVLNDVNSMQRQSTALPLLRRQVQDAVMPTSSLPSAVRT